MAGILVLTNDQIRKIMTMPSVRESFPSLASEIDARTPKGKPCGCRGKASDMDLVQRVKLAILGLPDSDISKLKKTLSVDQIIGFKFTGNGAIRVSR